MSVPHDSLTSRRSVGALASDALAIGILCATVCAASACSATNGATSVSHGDGGTAEGEAGGGGTDPATGGGGPTAAPAPEVDLKGNAVTWDAYQLIVPPTMTATPAADTLLLQRDGCAIMFAKPIAAQGDLDTQAAAILQTAFTDPSRWSRLTGEIGSSPLDEYYHLNGVAGQGWPYVDMRGRLLDKTGLDNGERVRILAADVGGRVGIMVGYQTKPNCIDDVLNPYEWVLVFYSLKFPSYQGDSSALAKRLIGGWFGTDARPDSTINTAWGDIFAANGRHSDMMTLETFHQLSSTEYEDRFSSWAGNGTWAASGSLLTIWPDGKPAKTTHFRIFQEHGSFLYYRHLGWCEDHYCEGWSTPHNAQ